MICIRIAQYGWFARNGFKGIYKFLRRAGSGFSTASSRNTVYIALLYNESPLHNPSNEKKKWTDARDAAKAVLDLANISGEYKLWYSPSPESYPLVNAKKGGIVRSKTRYLLAETDIDTLVTTEYLETRIP